jgi:hypothetical protein
MKEAPYSKFLGMDGDVAVVPTTTVAFPLTITDNQIRAVIAAFPPSMFRGPSGDGNDGNNGAPGYDDTTLRAAVATVLATVTQGIQKVSVQFANLNTRRANDRVWDSQSTSRRLRAPKGMFYPFEQFVSVVLIRHLYNRKNQALEMGCQETMILFLYGQKSQGLAIDLWGWGSLRQLECRRTSQLQPFTYCLHSTMTILVFKQVMIWKLNEPSSSIGSCE